MINTNTTTEKLSTCNCAEVFRVDIIDKKPHKRRLPFNPHHNCDYVSKRNRFVNEAAIYAQDKLAESNVKEPERASAIFNSFYSKKMDELCKHLVN